MTSFANGLIECFCGPTEKGAPDNLEQVIVDFIDGAGVELQVAVQEIDHEPIARTLVRAKPERASRSSWSTTTCSRRGRSRTSEPAGTGTGLAFEGELIQLSAYADSEPGTPTPAPVALHIRRPSRRRAT